MILVKNRTSVRCIDRGDRCTIHYTNDLSKTLAIASPLRSKPAGAKACVPIHFSKNVALRRDVAIQHPYKCLRENTSKVTTSV
ncbi:hypothetical protein [Nostoc sp. 'Peltigera membranacea cyanobiont' 232]|uniref:hypothetical protein n=1 Tax=Nostoc sp. 'Peltigera membranacea cyanobiont' 232 TaxID=2014531 RepID=UPI0011805840|nr:hypothetical protein [Nostoc sp. 'Peltigera membranacea cyanobiont' 232]